MLGKNIINIIINEDFNVPSISHSISVSMYNMEDVISSILIMEMRELKDKIQHDHNW